MVAQRWCTSCIDKAGGVGSGDAPERDHDLKIGVKLLKLNQGAEIAKGPIRVGVPINAGQKWILIVGPRVRQVTLGIGSIWPGDITERIDQMGSPVSNAILLQVCHVVVCAVNTPFLEVTGQNFVRSIRVSATAVLLSITTAITLISSQMVLTHA